MILLVCGYVLFWQRLLMFKGCFFIIKKIDNLAVKRILCQKYLWYFTR